MIKLTKLKYFYKKNKVLDIESFIINDGDRIAFMGLNGAGKTTLIELILNLKNSYKGNFYCDKKYIYNAVFQDSNFNADISLKDIFYLYCKLYKISLDHNIYFNNFELKEIMNNKFIKISAGQQQKFKFLIALLNKPNFLVLDEISTSLDYKWKIKIINIIYNYVYQNNEINLLLVSHNPEEVAKICNRVIFFRKRKNY
ncbi:ATP-binding cassette domain-containing protein [Spiroplasma endosymbiont of Dioctria linearis]|uniref:ATP-binding cassette domain-containing protein n=1 Tax=Spiroplasma endosymbiont of Dioctria linearis TaxID=3066290 RepID=UPI00313C56C8